MEGQMSRPPNNSGQFLRMEIKQKSTHTKKRKVKTWSPEEDDQLVKLYEQYPKKWGIIASLMQDRNENQCLHRYRRLSQLGTHKKIWSAEEDQTIVSLIRKVGKNWKLLAEIIGSKTGKQIRERFINKLDPKIKTEQWTDEEDRLVLKYYSQVGSRWSEISKKLVGRPENKIKNRFYSYIQKNYDIQYIYADLKSPSSESSEEEKSQEVPTKKQNEQKPEKQTRKIHLRQLPLNEKKNQLPQKIQHRLKPRCTRFPEEQRQQQNIFEEQSDNERPSLKKIKNTNVEKILKEQIVLPSIKQLEDEFKILPEIQQLQSRIEIAQQNYDPNSQNNQKFYIKSLIRVEDEVGTDSRYRSIRDLVSHNFIENNENDLFYLSHN